MTPDRFKQILPEFGLVDSAKIQASIDLADAFFDVARWDNMYELGLANWVADRLVRAPIAPTADDGAETSSSVGDTSWSLHPELVLAMARDPSMRTRYGQEYRYYAGLVGMGGVIV